MAKGEIFTGLPKWAQGVIAVVIIGGIGVVGYTIYKKINTKLNPTDAKKEVDAITDEVKQLEAQGQKGELSKSQIAGLANSIQTALSGMTEDEATVYKAFETCKNYIDVLNLIKAYGERRVGYWYWSYFTGTLPSTITQLFSASEVKKINDILAKKKIKYTF